MADNQCVLAPDGSPDLFSKFLPTCLLRLSTSPLLRGSPILNLQRSQTLVRLLHSQINSGRIEVCTNANGFLALVVKVHHPAVVMERIHFRVFARGKERKRKNNKGNSSDVSVRMKRQLRERREKMYTKRRGKKAKANVRIMITPTGPVLHLARARQFDTRFRQVSFLRRVPVRGLDQDVHCVGSVRFDSIRFDRNSRSSPTRRKVRQEKR